MALTQCLLEGLMQLFRVNLALVEIHFHQLLIDLNNLINDLCVGLLNGGEDSAAGRIEKTIDHRLTAIARQIYGQTLPAKRLANILEQRRQIHIMGIDLIDNYHAAEFAVSRTLHHALGHHLDARLRTNDHRSRVNRRQCG